MMKRRSTNIHVETPCVSNDASLDMFHDMKPAPTRKDRRDENGCVPDHSSLYPMGCRVFVCRKGSAKGNEDTLAVHGLRGGFGRFVMIPSCVGLGLGLARSSIDGRVLGDSAAIGLVP